VCHAAPLAAGGAAPREAAARFVREGLGCRCPEEVFQRLEAARDVEIGGVAAAWRLDVGGRLLVYVLESRSPAAIERVARAARTERDRCGYHRVRVAVLGDDPDRLAPLLEPAWQRVLGDDPRAHLHVLPTAAVMSLCAPC
jgi:hypothetical protein